MARRLFTPLAVLRLGSVLVFLATLPFELIFSLREADSPPLLTTVHLYASLAPVAALPALLPDAEALEPLVAASCMSTVVRAHIGTERVEAVHAFFDAFFFAGAALAGGGLLCGGGLPPWSRVGGTVAAAAAATVAVAALVPELDATTVEGWEPTTCVVLATGEFVFFAGVALRLLRAA